jgi:hypothetical protein
MIQMELVWVEYNKMVQEMLFPIQQVQLTLVKF